MDIHGRKPIVSNEVTFGFAVWYMLSVRDVSFRETKINHIYDMGIFSETSHTIAELDVTMKEPSIMHKFKALYLWYPVSE